MAISYQQADNVIASSKIMLFYISLYYAICISFAGDIVIFFNLYIDNATTKS